MLIAITTMLSVILGPFDKTYGLPGELVLVPAVARVSNLRVHVPSSVSHLNTGLINDIAAAKIMGTS
jgi:hypothetical protein